MSRSEPAIPVITVGGFLGAGKTTLVNHLLSQSDGQRIVVFVNDFGAINIDYDLIETSDTDRISLANGCVCCSLNDDLIGAIVQFCADDPPDAFVIEASGVADPRALDQSIATLQNAGHVRAAGRVYVLDLDQFGGLDYADTEQIVDHAVASDIVILNKSDLASESQLQTVETLLYRSSPYTAVVQAQFCAVPMSVLLDLTLGPLQSGTSQLESAPHDAEGFVSWSCAGFAPVSRSTFEAVIAELQGRAIRAKGIVFFEHDPETAVQVDLVGQRFFEKVLGPVDGSTGSSFVAIGRREVMPQDSLARDLLTGTIRHSISVSVAG